MLTSILSLRFIGFHLNKMKGKTEHIINKTNNTPPATDTGIIIELGIDEDASSIVEVAVFMLITCNCYYNYKDNANIIIIIILF